MFCTRTCPTVACHSEVRCKALPPLLDGTVEPRSCTTRRSPFGSRCTFTCRRGYTMLGPYSRQCTEDGYWTPDDTLENKCIGQSNCVHQRAYTCSLM